MATPNYLLPTPEVEAPYDEGFYRGLSCVWHIVAETPISLRQYKVSIIPSPYSAGYNVILDGVSIGSVYKLGIGPRTFWRITGNVPIDIYLTAEEAAKGLALQNLDNRLSPGLFPTLMKRVYQRLTKTVISDTDFIAEMEWVGWILPNGMVCYKPGLEVPTEEFSDGNI